MVCFLGVSGVRTGKRRNIFCGASKYFCGCVLYASGIAMQASLGISEELSIRITNSM